jgi:hypothetical protein
VLHIGVDISVEKGAVRDVVGMCVTRSPALKVSYC